MNKISAYSNFFKEIIDTIGKVVKEIKVYSEQEHLENSSEEIKELYEKLKNAILNFDSIEIKPKKLYVAFVSGRNVVDVLPQRKALKMWINMNKGELDDTKGITRDVSTNRTLGKWRL